MLIVLHAAAFIAASPLGAPEPACAPWTKNADPVWEGLFLAADPCVVRFGGRYLLYHTAYLPEPDRALIAVAESPDGLSWDWATPTTPEDPVSIALDGRPGEWDESLETVHVFERSGELWMLYTGYVPDESRFVNPFEIGLATSADGITWTRASDQPVLPLDPGGIDNGAMTSPAAVEVAGVLHMVYLSWTLGPGGELSNFQLSGATSTNGLSWARHPEPVLTNPVPGAGWIDTATEPTIMRASDGRYYLFITADVNNDQASPTAIAALWSDHPFGPWTPCDGPLVRATEPWESEEVVAPHVLEDGGRLRMWYHGLTLDDPLTGERFRVGYAESPPFPPNPCPADVNNDGVLDGGDFFAWVAAFGNGDPAADINQNGVVDGSDFFAWVAAFGDGC